MFCLTTKMDKEQLKKLLYWLKNVTLELYHYCFFDQSKTIVVDHLYTVYKALLELEKNLPYVNNTFVLEKYKNLEKSYFYAFTLMQNGI